MRPPAEATPLSTPASPSGISTLSLFSSGTSCSPAMVMPLIFKSGGQIEGKAANLVDAVVAHGHVIVADRGVVFHHV